MLRGINFSTKIMDGYSTCFRQWRAEDTHCKFLHGYAVKVQLTFEGTTDDRNWVVDFGFAKRAKSKITLFDGTPRNLKEWFDYMLDHTTLIAETDPQLDRFIELDRLGVIQLRILPEVGCERLAELIYEVVSTVLSEEFPDRDVTLTSVSVIENEKNQAGVVM